MQAVTLDGIENLISLSDKFLELMEENNRSPEVVKPSVNFKIGDICEAVGKDRKTIIALEEKGIIEPKERTPGGHRTGYTLTDLNAVRKHYDLLPWRDERDDCMILACQSFKGGVGKTVQTVCLAHGLALRGYRVLVVDLDPQATTTSSFGYIPDHERKGRGHGIEDELTIAPYMRNDYDAASYSLRDTNWSGIDLIPSNLSNHNLEYDLFSEMGKAGSNEEVIDIFSRLREGLDSVKDNYDVIILDSPPSLGVISLNILQAADGLIVPSPPRMYDFSSTIQFCRMVYQNMSTINKDKEYQFLKILVNQYDQRVADQTRFVDAMRHCFKDYMMQSIFYNSADIQKAASAFKSPYEYKATRKKTIDMIDSVVDEVEALVRSSWTHSTQSFSTKFGNIS